MESILLGLVNRGIYKQVQLCVHIYDFEKAVSSIHLVEGSFQLLILLI